MSKLAKPYLSVIIPGYNEEEIIKGTIIAVENALESIGKPFEILIVDDASKDRTAEILKSLVKSRRHPSLRFVSYKEGPSRRENLARSFRLLRGQYIILLDMDLAMDLVHMGEMLHFLEKGYDVVLANRYLKGSKIVRDPRRFVVSKLYNRFIRMFFRTGIKDNICGFKAFRKNAVMALVKDAGIDKSGTRSVFWDTEIVIRALRKGMQIKELPVHWKEGKSSALTFRREVKMLPYIIKFWLAFPRKK